MTPVEVIAATLHIPYAESHAKRIIAQLRDAGYEIRPTHKPRGAGRLPRSGGVTPAVEKIPPPAQNGR